MNLLSDVSLFDSIFLTPIALVRFVYFKNYGTKSFKFFTSFSNLFNKISIFSNFTKNESFKLIKLLLENFTKSFKFEMFSNSYKPYAFLLILENTRRKLDVILFLEISLKMLTKFFHNS